MVGVAGGATRAAITQHQDRQNNISDGSAKDGSQETLVNLSALLVNLAILPLIAEDPLITWTLFFVMTFLHLFANFKGVKSLKFETLNRERLLIVLRELFFASNVISVDEANEKESVLLGFGLEEKSILGKRIKFGCSFESAMERFGHDPRIINNLIKKIQSEKYAVFGGKENINHEEEEVVNVIFADDVTKEEEFRAFLDAALIARFGEDNSKSSDEILDLLRKNGYRTDFFQASTLGFSGSFKKMA